MTHSQFLTKRLGKKTDYDNVFSYQCVDLAKQYMKDVYNIESSIFGGSAAAGYDSESPFANNPKAWKKIPRSDTVTPQQGDIIFWPPSKNNAYGHVAVVDSIIGTTKVKVIEQNGIGGGDGLAGNAIRLKEYFLKNTLGWYRHQIPLSDIDQTVIDIILHNNGKLYHITNDVDLKTLLAQTSKRIRELYI